MYKNYISIEELAKKLRVSRYIVEDGTYIMEWNDYEYFNDIYEVEDYKVFITKSYNYFNNKIGIMNVNDGRTYVVLVKINDKTVVDKNYDIIHNYTDNYIFTYKLGILVEVDCINKRSGRVETSKFLEDYSYNVIDTDWLRTARKKIMVIHDNNKLKFKIKHNQIKLTNENGNYVIFITIENIYQIFESYPKFDNLRFHLISLVI